MSKIGRWALILLALSSAAVAAKAENGLPYPSPSQAWTKREYVDFYFAHYNGNTALPHLRAGPQRTLFARLVDPGNLPAIVESGKTENERRQNINVVLAVMGAVRASYNISVVIGEPLQEELTRVQIFTIEVLDAAVPLWSSEPGGRQEAWKTTFFGIMRSLSETNIYSEEQIVRLSEAVVRHYPAIAAIFTEADKRQLRSQVEALLAAETSERVAGSFSQLMQVIRAN
jgi:hypothetical protein